MNFEKWQSLGNDYLIIEADALPFELTPANIRYLCDHHRGIGADGIVRLSKPSDRGFVADLVIYNPDGSEAELSGNGARQACLYLKRARWTDADSFSVQTKAGELRVEIINHNRCRLDMGRARLQTDNFPTGPKDGIGEVRVTARALNFQHITIGNPQCAVQIEDEDLSQLPIAELGEPISNSPLFPNRTTVSFWQETTPGTIRARIFERGVGETHSSGTGACGAAVAYVLGGGDSPVTVAMDGGELEVDVEESLRVDLTGAASCVYRGSLNTDLTAALASTGE